MTGARDEPIRVVVADDQTAMREGLVTLLGLIAGLSVVGAASNGEEAVALSARADVVLMDLRMPVCNGVEATRRIRSEHPATEVVVLTTHADDESIVEALEAGARGFLTKDAGRAEIELAIRAAAAGQTLLDTSVRQALVDLAAGRRRSLPVALPDGLTQREGEVLRMIAAGRTNAEIARELVLTGATIKSHVNHIFSKTGVADRAQAVRYAYEHGLISARDPE